MICVEHTFSLKPHRTSGDSCTLALLISGAVNGNAPAPEDHLFVCFPGGKTCAGTQSPLNVTSVPSTQPIVAAGLYLDNDSNQFIALATSTNQGKSCKNQ